MKSNDRIYAMKTLNKWEMLKRAEVSSSFIYSVKYCLVFWVNFDPTIGSASVLWKLNELKCLRSVHSYFDTLAIHIRLLSDFTIDQMLIFDKIQHSYLFVKHGNS